MACTWLSFFAFRAHQWCHSEGMLFSEIFCQFSRFHWSNFDLELIYFTLSMNTSSYHPIASGTYNCWRVEFVLKTKNDQNINTTQAMAELYTMRLGGSHFYTFYIIAVWRKCVTKVCEFCIWMRLCPSVLHTVPWPMDTPSYQTKVDIFHL